MEKQISVIMAVYNGARYIKDSIESVLSQSFGKFEFIIINDGSIDETEKIIKKYNDKRIKYVYQDNCGCNRSRNKAILKSKCDYIAIIDADDIWCKYKLEKQYNFLECNKDVVAVGSNAKIIDKDGCYIFTTNFPKSHQDIIKNAPSLPIVHSSMIYRKSKAKECGMYDIDFIIGADSVLFNKMSRIGRMHNINEPLVKYRIIPDSISRKSKKDEILIRKAINLRINDKKVPQYLFEKIRSNLNKKKSIDKYYNYYFSLSKKYLKYKKNIGESLFMIKKSMTYKITFSNFILFVFLSLMLYIIQPFHIILGKINK